MQKAYEDYTQLFIGPNSLYAPLCESVYFRL
ncbi:molecular chaperone TorD family protein [Bacillus velezensis]